MDLFLDSAKSAKLELACLEGVKKIVATALRKGLANTDYSAIYDAVDPREGAETQLGLNFILECLFYLFFSDI